MIHKVSTCCLVAAVVCVFAGSAMAELLAYEGFDYTGDALTKQNGGVGFDGAWTGTTMFREISTTGQSLTMPNLHFATQGDHLRGTAYTYDVWHTAQRQIASTIDFGQEGQYFVGMLIQRPTETNAKAALRGMNAAGEQLWRFEIASGYSVPFVGIGGNGTINNGPYAYADDGAFRMAVGVTYFMIAKIQTHADAPDTISLKLYGPEDTIDLEQPDVWNASVSADVSGVFSKLRVDLGKGFTTALDEIRLGTTWESVVVPEPGAMSLLVLGGIALARRRVK